MARPKAKIDPETVEKLAAIHCTVDEMASVLGCDRRTLQRRFALAMENGRNKGKMSLRRKQYELATGGNVPMLIWLGKQLLEQRDRREMTIEDMSKERFDQFLEGVAARIKTEISNGNGQS